VAGADQVPAAPALERIRPLSNMATAPAAHRTAPRRPGRSPRSTAAGADQLGHDSRFAHLFAGRYAASLDAGSFRQHFDEAGHSDQ
jgi:hypothetical protein